MRGSGPTLWGWYDLFQVQWVLSSLGFTRKHPTVEMSLHVLYMTKAFPHVAPQNTTLG